MKPIYCIFTIVILLCRCDNIYIGLPDPQFNFISPNWNNNINKISMNDIWKYFNIPAKGNNYYFFPNPINGRVYSERFNPNSDYFQSWFGIYTIEKSAKDEIYGIKNNKLIPEDILKLAKADQIAWLTEFAGLPQPSVSIDSSKKIEKRPVIIDGREGWKMTARLLTNCDVGENNNQTEQPQLLTIPPDAWNNKLKGYSSIILDVVFYIWYAPENEELNVIYYTGAEYIDLNGITYKTFENIELELDSMAQNVTIRKLSKSIFLF